MFDMPICDCAGECPLCMLAGLNWDERISEYYPEIPDGLWQSWRTQENQ